MPKLLFILSNHIDKSDKEFLTTHLKALKAIGYNTLLLEMNSEVSVDNFKMQLRLVTEGNTRNRLPQHLVESTVGLYNLILALEKENISLKFIDPQTQSEAHVQASLPRGIVAQLAVERDKIMFERIKGYANNPDNGIIVSVGFMHRALLRAIMNDEKLKGHVTPCYFGDFDNASIYDRKVQKESDIKHLNSMIDNIAFRDEFYGSHVPFYPPFKNEDPDCVINFLNLAYSQPLNNPNYSMGTAFAEKIGRSLDYKIDNNGIVSGETITDSPQEALMVECKVKTYFPSVMVKKVPHKDKMLVSVHGINLPSVKP